MNNNLRPAMYDFAVSRFPSRSRVNVWIRGAVVIGLFVLMGVQW